MVATVPGPHGPVEVRSTGTGEPVTLLLHGLGGSIDDTRPFGSGVPGTRWFAHLRGHGGTSSPDEPWTYAGLAREAAAVADAVGADRAVGVSMGAGALLALVAADPRRFDRLVLVLPAAFDRPGAGRAPEPAAAVADAVDAGDVRALADLLAVDLPAPPTPTMRSWVEARAERLAGTAVSRGYRDLVHDAPVPDPAVLRAVTAETLVLAGEGDPVHPVAVAEAVVAALPAARLAVLPPGGLLWAHRAEVRRLVTAALTERGTRRR